MSARVARRKAAREQARAAAEALYPAPTLAEFKRIVKLARAEGREYIEAVMVRLYVEDLRGSVYFAFSDDAPRGPASDRDRKLERVAPDCYRARWRVHDCELWLGRHRL